MKLKNIFILSTAALMVAACGKGATGSDASANSVNSASSQAANSQQSVNSQASQPNSSRPNSSSKSSSSKSSISKTFSKYTPITREVKLKDYHIFDKVPEIRFTTNDTSANALDWATRPGKNDEKPEVEGKLSVTNAPDGMDLADLKAFMKVRGNWTSNYQKKPFRIKLDKKKSLLGLNEGKQYKKWVLLADVKDTSMLRNALGFYIGGAMSGDDLFTSDFTPVHVYLNNQYWGMYLLGEQKEVKEGRVNVDAREDENKNPYAGTDTGYLFELDHYYKEEAAKGDAGDPTFEVDYKPRAINYSAQGQQYGESNVPVIEKGYTLGSDIGDRSVQLPFLKKCVENAYEVIYNAAFNDTTMEIVNNKVVESTEGNVEACLAKTIDIDSFVSAYILSELSCDPDVGYSSFYMSLDMSEGGNKLLTCNCPWDFDTTFGIRTGTVENAKGIYTANSTNMWLSMLPKIPFFQQRVKEKWNEAYSLGLFDKAYQMIETFASKYSADYTKNFQQWPNTMGRNPETSHEVRQEVQNCTSHAQSVNQMKVWFKNRVNFLNNEFNNGSKSVDELKEEFKTFKSGATKTRLEAENAVLNQGNGTNQIGVGKVNEGSDGYSGQGYVNNLDGNANASMTFKINSEKAQTALINAGLSARDNERKFTDMFKISINGEELDPVDIGIVKGSVGTRDYHYWTSVDLCFANLKVGENTIVVSSTGNATNFDYLDIFTK